MKKVSKKILILGVITGILILSLVGIFIYQYKNGFPYLTLNDTDKSSDDYVQETEDTDDDTLTEEVEETIKAEESQSSNTSTTASSLNWWEYPDEILETEKDGDNLLVLVTKKYKLPSAYAPSDLVKASESGIRRGENYYLRNIVIDDLTRLVEDISREGIDLCIVSGYRSYATQESTYQYWVNYNDGSTSEADKISARAGHSQHQLGTVVDFSTSEIDNVVGSKFNGTDAQIWLSNNAYKYGFALSYPSGAEEVTGYSYESWHYRYIGVENATNWKDSGLILDQWLESR